MPTYEYACAECGHEWEQMQRITEPPVEVCPHCSKTAAHRLISAGTNFILKGGGWYSDLYASPKAAAKKGDANGGGSADKPADSTGSAGSPTTEAPKAPAAASTSTAAPSAPSSSAPSSS